MTSDENNNCANYIKLLSIAWCLCGLFISSTVSLSIVLYCITKNNKLSKLNNQINTTNALLNKLSNQTTPTKINQNPSAKLTNPPKQLITTPIQTQIQYRLKQPIQSQNVYQTSIAASVHDSINQPNVFSNNNSNIPSDH